RGNCHERAIERRRGIADGKRRGTKKRYDRKRVDGYGDREGRNGNGAAAGQGGRGRSGAAETGARQAGGCGAGTFGTGAGTGGPGAIGRQRSGGNDAAARGPDYRQAIRRSDDFAGRRRYADSATAGGGSADPQGGGCSHG